jgi:uncharacterized protein YkwD
MRWRAVSATLVAAIVTALPVVAATPAHADTTSDSAESAFVAKINDLRASKGVQPLQLDLPLTAAARNWSAKMAEKGTIFHQPDLSVMGRPGWTLLGENVGMGGDVDSLFRAFVESPHHYENLVNPAFNRIGVGVVVGADGTLYTAHEFMALKAPAAAGRPVAAAAPRSAAKATPKKAAKKAAVRRHRKAPRRAVRHR